MPRFPLPWRRDVAKAATLAPQTPAAITEAMAAQGMDSATNMGPGRPINPAWSYSGRPRAMDYPVGVNITGGDSRIAWSRTPYSTLRAIIGAYDIARDCINHKIDELRSMEPLVVPVDGFSGDADAAIDAAKAALEFPDRQLPYDAWLSKWLEGCLKFDAGHLYKRRNYDGDIIGLEVVDGTTLAPLLDEFGRRPRPPAFAWEQVIKGLRTTSFTTDDIVPTIFRPQEDSPYGLAPIESVLLTVNTDIRHQWHFLQMFTDGSVPAGFMEVPPDTSSPDQVDEWQAYWDAFMLGDQAKLHQIVAVPSGSKLTETRPKTFDIEFAKFLMLRTCAAYGVVPQDLGLVDDVNRANGETQVDVQFRVNVLPWVRFVEGVLSRYLKRDLGLPVQVKLDTGRDKEDRKSEAEAWQIYVNTGAASVDEMREELLGLPTNNERPVPRFVLDPRVGPVPLRSIEAISGPIDPETAAPADDQPLDTTPYDGAAGVMPYKVPGGLQFHRAETDPDEPRFPELQQPVPGSDTAGLAQPPAPTAPAPVAKSAADELAAFRRFVTKAAKTGRWRRDFAFETTDHVTARDLNRHARLRVRKAAGEVAVAGLAVVAADTGRVLMLQRALDPTDPAGGTWEFPGGHIEAGELPGDGARREWSEETGLEVPFADGSDEAPAWTSANGVYGGYVQVIPAEADLPIFDRADGWNPDDPDGDATEALAWWEPETLVGNPAVRPELADSLDTVLPLLEQVSQGKAPDPVAKSWRDGDPQVPQQEIDLRLTDYWAPRVGDALAALLTDEQIRAAITTAQAELGTVAKSAPEGETPDDPGRQIADRLAQVADPAAAEQVMRQMVADAWQAGGLAANRILGPGTTTLDAVDGLDWGSWEPGNPLAASLDADGGLAELLGDVGVRVKDIIGTALDSLGNRIAEGLLAGHNVDTIASSLADWVTGARAEMIAHTETARAVTQASLATYDLNGIRQWDLVLSAGACPVCTDVAAANPHTGQDDTPPLHPRCRCAASPHIPADWTAPAANGQ